MEFGSATFLGQVLGFVLLVLLVYLLVLVPISLGRVARHLAEIRDELRKRNDSGSAGRKPD